MAQFLSTKYKFSYLLTESYLSLSSDFVICTFCPFLGMLNVMLTVMHQLAWTADGSCLAPAHIHEVT